jgi:hypothetical protein
LRSHPFEYVLELTRFICLPQCCPSRLSGTIEEEMAQRRHPRAILHQTQEVQKRAD